MTVDLPDAGDISRELDKGNLAAAHRLRQQFDEDVLVLDLLDWGEQGDRDAYTINLPTEQAEQVFQRLRGSILGTVEEAVSAMLQHPVAEALEAAHVCTEVLRTLHANAEDSAGRRACSLHDVPRRPECA